VPAGKGPNLGARMSGENVGKPNQRIKFSAIIKMSSQLILPDDTSDDTLGDIFRNQFFLDFSFYI
jgi:hypothetical protein